MIIENPLKIKNAFLIIALPKHIPQFSLSFESKSERKNFACSPTAKKKKIKKQITCNFYYKKILHQWLSSGRYSDYNNKSIFQEYINRRCHCFWQFYSFVHNSADLTLHLCAVYTYEHLQENVCMHVCLYVCTCLLAKKNKKYVLKKKTTTATTTKKIKLLYLR